jgi:HAE1 family hydrophobic/amphiphilic exporter-1
VVILVFGIITFTRVKQELIPDIQFPIFTVIAQSPNSPPDELAATTTSRIESAAASLDGFRSTQSTVVDGLSVTLINLEFGSSIDAAEQQMNESLAAAGIPDSVTTSILKFDVSLLPVVDLSLEGNLSQSELTTIAQQQIVPALSSLDGVGAVDVVGTALNEVAITINRDQMLAAGLTFDGVAAALAANNVVIPSGTLATADTTIPVETVAVYRSLDEIRATGIRAADGRTVRLDSIAAVEVRESPATGRNRTNGQPAIGISVAKTQDANTVTVAHAVIDELDRLEATLPAGVSITIFQDQAEFITESINSVIEEGVIGGFLAIIVVFVFLANPRTTLITAVSIPLSIISAVIILDQFGYSLNLMTLGGLTIAIGRVIDDSIVVLENVYRHMTQGERPFPAIINGAREVTIAILGATATTCAVFLPLGLIGGLIGQLFLPFAVAVVAALVASLIIAVTVIPVLARYALANKVKVQEERRPADTLPGRVYTPILKWALANRWKTLGIAGALFIGSLALVPLLPVAFLPDSGEKIITVEVDARPGQTQQSVLDQAIQVEGLLGQLGVERYETVITGASSDFGAIGQVISGRAPNSATITVELSLSGQSKNDAADELRALIEERVSGGDNITVSASGGGFTDSGIALTVAVENDAAAPMLAEATQRITEAVAAVDDTANVKNDLASGQPSVEVTVNPQQALAAGLTPEQVAASIRNLSIQRTVTNVDLGDGPLAMRLQIDGSAVDSISDLSALEITRGVRLDSVATLRETTNQVSITRVDGRLAATITGDISSENVGAVSTSVQSAANGVDLPEGIEVSVGGVAGDIEQGFADMFIAIGISIVLVYTIMTLLFGSWLDPLVILFSLPLAVIGAIVALVITGSALSISSLIGMLMLVGIVVTNAIVMLEYVILLQHERGYNVYDAVVEGAQTRLRPILMTAIAAMLALVPLSLGLTEGALIASDLGRTVIGGLFTSTLLTLLVVPVAYSLMNDLKLRMARRSERLVAEEVQA